MRTEDGRLVARGESGEMGVKDYLAEFRERESGVSAGADFRRIGRDFGPEGAGRRRGGVDLDKIKPGMSREEMERVRQEIIRVASHPRPGLAGRRAACN